MRWFSVALLPMRFLPDPILRRQARKINPIPKNFKKHIDNMIETMRAHDGVGLAAPQVGGGVRVIVVDVLPRNALGKVLKRELRERYA